jgi:2-haloacid dehalogenase
MSSGGPGALKAIVFDVFGTVVDWRGAIIAEGAEWGRAKDLKVDWAEFADRWRSGYPTAMEKVRRGDLPWTKLDDLHRSLLEDLLEQFHITGLAEDEKVHWNHVWRRLTPWADAVEGLSRLKRKFVIAPLSNGDFALLTNMAKTAGLPWDAIFSAELVRRYKPDPEVYLSAVDLLGLAPAEVMMAAAHVGDLEAAAKLGLRTGFVSRPEEFGPGRRADRAAPGDFDIVAADIVDLARQLGA